MDVLSLAIGKQYTRDVFATANFPSYFPPNLLEEWLAMDTLDGWSISLQGDDTVEIVNEIDTSHWPPEAKSRINTHLPNGKETCLKLNVHSGTSMVYGFSQPIDLTGKALGALVFIDTVGKDAPSQLLIRVDLRSAGSNSYVFPLTVNNCLDNNWFLFTFHPMEHRKWNNPDWSDIRSVRFIPQLSQSENISVYVSSIFQIPNTRSRGAIMIDFDDGIASVTEAYRYTTGEYGYRGNCFINGKYIDERRPTQVTPEMLLRMQDDGWVIGNHTWTHTNWRGEPYEKQREHLIRNMEWMTRQGFWFGNQVYACTNYSMDYNMYHNLRSLGFKTIRAVYNNGRGGYITPAITRIPYCQPIPSNEINNTVSLETWQAHLQDVQDNKALAVNVFHGIGGSGSTSTEHFRALIDEIQNYDIDVITYADLLMM